MTAPWVEDDKPQVIVVGFGRFGRVIGRLLMANKMRITVLGTRYPALVNLMRNMADKVSLRRRDPARAAATRRALKPPRVHRDHL